MNDPSNMITDEAIAEEIGEMRRRGGDPADPDMIWWCAGRLCRSAVGRPMVIIRGPDGHAVSDNPEHAALFDSVLSRVRAWARRPVSVGGVS